MRRWKHGLAWAGFGLAVVAVAMDRSAIAWAAICLLGLSFALRLVERFRARRSASTRDSLSE